MGSPDTWLSGDIMDPEIRGTLEEIERNSQRRWRERELAEKEEQQQSVNLSGDASVPVLRASDV